MISDILDKKLGKIKFALIKSAKILETEMHTIVAIKTGKLDKSIKTGQLKELGSVLSIEVGSFGVGYAKFVETSKTVKNYHRNLEVVYTGRGQKWLARSLNNVKPTILRQISQAFR